MAESFDSLDEKALSELSDDQLLDAINALRSRRQAARERRVVERSAAEQATKKRRGPEEIVGNLGSALDAIFADDSVLCEKCGKPMIDGVCGNLRCE